MLKPPHSSRRPSLHQPASGRGKSRRRTDDCAPATAFARALVPPEIAAQHGSDVRLAASVERVSDPREESLDAQYLVNRQRAEEDGFVIPDHPAFRFQDDATKGDVRHRNGVNRLLATVQDGHAPFERAYARDRDRFGRWKDPRRHNFFEVLLEEHGCELIYSTKARKPSDYADPTAQRDSLIGDFLTDTVDVIRTAEEKRSLVERVTTGMRARVLDGHYPGGLAPYGMERWLVNKHTGVLVQRAPDRGRLRLPDCRYSLRWSEDGPGRPYRVVREIFEALGRGESMSSVAAALNRRGVATPARRRGRTDTQGWFPTTVGRIAQNPLYAGVLVWGRTTREGDPVDHDTRPDLRGAQAIRRADFLPDAPVSPELWARVQEVLARNCDTATAQRASKAEFPLTGLLKCVHCGRAFSGHTHRGGRTGDRPDVVRRSYRHVPTRSVGHPTRVARCPCENRYVPAVDVEGAAAGIVERVLEDGGLARLVDGELRLRADAAQATTRHSDIERLREDLARAEAALANSALELVRAATEAEKVGLRAVRQELGASVDALTAQIAEQTRELDAIERARARTSHTSVRARELREAFRDGTPAVRKYVLRLVVERILVDPEAWSIDVEVRAELPAHAALPAPVRPTVSAVSAPVAPPGGEATAA